MTLLTYRKGIPALALGTLCMLLVAACARHDDWRDHGNWHDMNSRHREMMGGPGYTGTMMGGSVAETTRQLDEIGRELHIRPSQQQAWKRYRQAVIGQIALMQGYQQTRMPPDAQQQQAMHQGAYASMQERQQAAQELYRVLAPDQRTHAEQRLGGFGMMGGAMGTGPMRY